ncbi:MAG: hypothetical protein IPI58_01625 [Alphaproteobacteria bacterium]|nr:MAG: hypothetical protein IPI58_01625 [Alphaproteobacteria bacterium]
MSSIIAAALPYVFSIAIVSPFVGIPTFLIGKQIKKYGIDPRRADIEETNNCNHAFSAQHGQTIKVASTLCRPFRVDPESVRLTIPERPANAPGKAKSVNLQQIPAGSSLGTGISVAGGPARPKNAYLEARKALWNAHMNRK